MEASILEIGTGDSLASRSSLKFSIAWFLLLSLFGICPTEASSFRGLVSALPEEAHRFPGLKFSHRVHLLQFKADCNDCHATAWSSTSLADGSLLSEKDCLKCHDGRRAPNECGVCHENKSPKAHAQPYNRSLRFNHKLHVELGNVAPIIAAAVDSGRYMSPTKSIRGFLDQENLCVACHRGLEGVDLAKKENLPQMADCLVCHAEIDPPFSCQFCHTPEARIKPVSHTPDYLDSHNSGKIILDKQSCVICHGRRFRCMGCH
jgi:hypothetical protein